MAAERRKVDVECRSFQESWTLGCFFKERFGKPVCLICYDFVSVNKEYNIKRHYETKHAEFMKLSGKALPQQFSLFTRKRGENERNTQASYAPSKLIAEKMMPFAEGEFLKEYLMAVVDIVCPEEKSLVSNVSLSRRTVTRRIEDLAADVRGSLKDTCVGFDYFSEALDESTDLKDAAQLAVFI